MLRKRLIADESVNNGQITVITDDILLTRHYVSKQMNKIYDLNVISKLRTKKRR